MLEKIEINTDFIKLDQLLKHIGIVQTGGEAKMMIREGIISLNNEIVTQRGKKIKKGDIIQIENHNSYLVV